MRTFMQVHSASNGARDLANLLGVRRLRRRGSRWVRRPGDCILNWGSSNYVGVPNGSYVNHPGSVDNAKDKCVAYALMKEACVPTVEWTDDHSEALRWVASGEARVIHRSLSRGSQGRGMTVYSADGTEFTAPAHEFDALAFGGFYVKVFGDVRTNKEYRIHVVDGEVIDRQMKRRRSRDNGYEGTIDPYIRSSRNGWVFCREGLGDTEQLDQAARGAVEALGLDFGAVDIASSEEGEVCVYEVNTAPGLEGTTLQSYGVAIGRCIRARSSAATLRRHTG